MKIYIFWGQNCKLEFAMNWMLLTRNLESWIVCNSVSHSLKFNSFFGACNFHFNVHQSPQRCLLLRWCCALSIQVTRSLSLSLSLTFVTKNFAAIEFATIAERDLAPDPLHPRMKSNCISTRASTSMMKSSVFVAKLENWKMYFTIWLFPFSLFWFINDVRVNETSYVSAGCWRYRFRGQASERFSGTSGM